MQVIISNGNLDLGIKELKKKIARDGIFAAIKRREQSPNLTDRKKEKALIARRRRVVRERKKEFREKSYDHTIRMMDRGIKIFERTHRIG